MNTQTISSPAESRFFDPAEQDPRELLYDEYAAPHESLEDFCNRMAEDHGPQWISKLRRTR